MRTDKKQKRHQEISEAAYALLDKHGYGGTSMLSIAKAAGASNETLYRWYGDKQNLFAAMVQDNAAIVKAELEASLTGDDDPMAALTKIGAKLLTLLTGERAIALNRAAASDSSGALGATIAEAGRGTIAPLLEKLFARMVQTGVLAVENSSEATEIYLGLLIGDLQIRRVIGQLEPLSEAACSARSDRALVLLRKLYAA
ncbi:MAG: TetR/AcrR family transcriptional regulator [Alphaproteobacteria bacterium]|nr:TetR/AcrR family transcriptional regulator [Alphaproteobacteria bacterium]